jgi:hypothetical protein
MEMRRRSVKGLYTKYIIQKADGSPVDPDARYFILRLDDGEYVHACRAAAAVFARHVRHHNPDLADDLARLLKDYPSPFCADLMRAPLSLKPGWALPEKNCPECGVKMRPIALWTGDGWWLGWDCENTCSEAEGLPIEWPFGDGWATPLDLESAGFEVI